MPAGNGTYPMWTKETGGAPVANSTPAHTTVLASGTSKTLLAASSSRVAARIVNESDTETIWVREDGGGAADTATYEPLFPHGVLEIAPPFGHQKAIVGITRAAAVTAIAKVVQLT